VGSLRCLPAWMPPAETEYRGRGKDKLTSSQLSATDQNISGRKIGKKGAVQLPLNPAPNWEEGAAPGQGAKETSRERGRWRGKDSGQSLTSVQTLFLSRSIVEMQVRKVGKRADKMRTASNLAVKDADTDRAIHLDKSLA